MKHVIYELPHLFKIQSHLATIAKAPFFPEVKQLNLL